MSKTLPALLPRRDGEYGRMDPARWREFAGFMVDEDLLASLPAIDDVLTNELLRSNASSTTPGLG